MITPPSGRNALLVATLEFRFRALAIQVCAHGSILVRVITTIVFKVTSPAEWDASSVAALEVSCIRALRTILGIGLIRTVPAVVFSVTEEPGRDAAVVVACGTLSPAGGAVLVSTPVSRFIRVVAAVIFEITEP